MPKLFLLSRHPALALYLSIAAVYLLSASGRIGTADGDAMFKVSQSVVTGGSFSSDPCRAVERTNHCVTGLDGKHYAGFGVVPSVVATPALLAGRGLAAAFHRDTGILARLSVSLFTALVGPLTSVLLALWTVNLGYSWRTAVLTSFVVAFASPYWHHSVKGFYSEPYFTLGLVAAGYLLSTRRHQSAAVYSGLALGFACGSRVYGLILCPTFLVYLYLLGRETHKPLAVTIRSILHFLSGLGAWVIVLAVLNDMRFGSPLKTGYHLAFPSVGMLLSNPLLSGLRNLLFSGEVGLLVFVPWTLAAAFAFHSFYRRHPREAFLIAAIVLSNIVFFAKYSGWHGGWSFGPRLLVPIIPFLALLLAPVLESSANRIGFIPTALKYATLGLLSASLLIQLVCIPYPMARYYTLETYFDRIGVREWWSGSLIAASADFLPRITAAKLSTDTLNLQVDAEAQESGYAEQIAKHFRSNEELLDSMPNSINLTSADFLLAKASRLGLPPSLVIATIMILVVIAGFATLALFVSGGLLNALSENFRVL